MDNETALSLEFRRSGTRMRKDRIQGPASQTGFLWPCIPLRLWVAEIKVSGRFVGLWAAEDHLHLLFLLFILPTATHQRGEWGKHKQPF